MTLTFEVILATRNGTSSEEHGEKIICTRCVFARIIPIKYVFEASDALAVSSLSRFVPPPPPPPLPSTIVDSGQC